MLACLLLVPLLYSQNFKNYLPLPEHNRMVMLGEVHHIAEAYQIKYETVQHYAENRSCKIILFYEYSYSLNYFTDRLFQLGDSLSLKQYIAYSDESKHVRGIDCTDFHLQIMQFYHLNQQIHQVNEMYGLRTQITPFTFYTDFYVRTL